MYIWTHQGRIYFDQALSWCWQQMDVHLTFVDNFKKAKKYWNVCSTWIAFPSFHQSSSNNLINIFHNRHTICCLFSYTRGIARGMVKMVHHFGQDWNISTATWEIALKCCTEIPAPHMSPYGLHFGDPLTLPLASLWLWLFGVLIFIEMYKQISDGLKQDRGLTYMVPGRCILDFIDPLTFPLGLPWSCDF